MLAKWPLHGKKIDIWCTRHHAANKWPACHMHGLFFFYFIVCLLPLSSCTRSLFFFLSPRASFLPSYSRTLPSRSLLPSLRALFLLSLSPRALFSHRHMLSSFSPYRCMLSSPITALSPIAARSLLPSSRALFLSSCALFSHRHRLSSPIVARFLSSLLIAAHSLPLCLKGKIWVVTRAPRESSVIIGLP
ncbi:hypothetical protein AMTR_s00096p00118090 [Amborella trichopoda]|uniref:Transmembrane protein n=1 Tax=Amborella trichopoda TaxID=13333 RepID=W1P494_AMBTC|nr:hypothetical protein AMTR_s00096p00118090 [Amborella trichopoda]